jgi:hypothetical protein
LRAPGLLALSLPILALSVGTALAQPQMPYPQPPALRKEEPTSPSPGPQFIVQPGHWQPGGRDGYQWVPPRWIERPGRFSRFVHGRWAWGTVGWIWLQPHWE